MRYSFHGKVRATGQTIDGFIEAESASLAIDRLADKGIIGVYSVRPDPKPAKPPTGAPGDPTAQKPAGLLDRRNPKALPNGRPAVSTESPVPPAASKPAEAQPPDPATHELLKALAEKIASLTGKVETMLSKPSSVVYQQSSSRNAPVRESTRGPKRAPRLGGEQTSTLRDIFQNNLDLRQSLETLASSVGAPAARVGEPVSKSANGSHGPAHGAANGSTNGATTSNGASPNGAAVNGGSTNGTSGHESVANGRAVVNPPQPV